MATCTINAPGRFLAPSHDHWFDQALLAVWNGSTTKTMRLVRLEFDFPNYYQPDGAIAMAWYNRQPVVRYYRVTDGPPTGGTTLTPIARDTSSAALPGQVVLMANPTGGPSIGGSPVAFLRRGMQNGNLNSVFGGLLNSNTNKMLFQVEWDCQNDSKPEGFVIREGEGLAIYHEYWGPVNGDWHITFKVVATGAIHTLVTELPSYTDDVTRPSLCLWNGSGSGVVLEVLRIMITPVTPVVFENQDVTLHRLFKPPSGEAVTPLWHDPTDSVSEFLVYCGATCPTNAENVISGTGGLNNTATANMTLGARYQDDPLRMAQISPAMTINQQNGVPQLSWRARNDEDGFLIRPLEGFAVRFPTPQAYGFVASGYYGAAAGPIALLQAAAQPQWGWTPVINTRAMFASGPDETPSGGGPVVMNRIYVR